MLFLKKFNRVLAFGSIVLGASSIGLAQRSLTWSPDLTTTMDEGSATWYERGADATNPTAGLPSAGIVHAVSDPESTFIFQPYNGNNVLFLTGNTARYGSLAVTTGTLTFSQPEAPRSLGFAISSADFGATDPLNVTIHYADGTPDLSTTLGTVPDWTGGKGLVVASGSGKAFAYQNILAYVDQSATNVDVPRVFEMPLDVVSTRLANPSPISSIDVSLSSVDSIAGPNIAIFGVSGSQYVGQTYTPIALTASSFNQDIVLEATGTPAVPEPGTVGIIVVGAGMMIGGRRRRRYRIAEC